MESGSSRETEEGSSEKEALISDKRDHPLHYPKSVFFIVANEFCERFNFIGLRTILVLYLNYVLLYSPTDATVIFHGFSMLAYFFPLLGAIIADSWLGKYKTILYWSIIYAFGSVIMSIASISTLPLPQRELTMLGLFLIAMGTGGIKPCVIALGGDQFVLPEQESHLKKFFSVFYFAIHCASLVTTLLTPVLREDVHCFGHQSCFPLAFGVPALLMIVAIVAFVLGSKWYTQKNPEGNVVAKVCKCVWYGLTRKDSSPEKRHWLDKAEDDTRFDNKFINDVKCALKALIMFIPVPVFWALVVQQGSRWTFQAARMSGNLGNGVYMKPDQMQIINPIFTLTLVPTFEGAIYPAFAKCNLLKRPLAKMVVGGSLAGLAFVISALIEFHLQGTYPIMSVPGQGQLRIYNGMGCDIHFDIRNLGNISLPNLDNWEDKAIPMFNKTQRVFAVTYKDCQGARHAYNFTVYDGRATFYTFTPSRPPLMSEPENLVKNQNGDPMVMFIYSPLYSIPHHVNITMMNQGKMQYQFKAKADTLFQCFKKIPRGISYKINVRNQEVDGNFIFEQGGSYVVLAVDDGVNVTVNIHEVTKENTMHMLWLIPQYFVMTAGEVMYTISGLEFSFTQAPQSMKSLMTSAWLLSEAVGNLIVIIVAEAHMFQNLAYEFLLFAGFMFLDVLIFLWLVKKYKYVDEKCKKEDEDVSANNNELYQNYQD